MGEHWTEEERQRERKRGDEKVEGVVVRGTVFKGKGAENIPASRVPGLFPLIHLEWYL
jgi:hypothetical protein